MHDARSLVRRAVLLVVGVIASLSNQPLPASAQESLDVTMTLASQSAQNGPSRPLELSVRVINRTEEDLRDLSLVLLILAPARARSIYEASLDQDVTPVILAFSFPLEGALHPGRTRTFAIKKELDELTRRAESALYPLKVQLLSGDRAVAEIRTPMVFLFDPVDAPLLLAWTWELFTPLQYVPNGTFLPGPLEGDIAPGGRIATVIEALRRLGSVPFDMVPSSALLDQLERMAAGYQIRDADGTRRDVPAGTGGAANAANVLASLRDVAARPATEVMALPFADASIPALLRAGLTRDASDLLSLGRDRSAAILGRVPREDIFRPPGSDLDAATLAELSRMGTQTVVIDGNYAPPTPGLVFSPPPVIRLAAGRVQATAVRADDSIQAVARRFTDPRLGAQAALGALAAIWLELPGTDGRGVSLVLPGRMSPAALSNFARLVRNSPWLEPVIASRLPALATSGPRRPVPNHPSPDLDAGYVDQVLQARASLNQLAKTIPEATHMVEALQERLRTSLAVTFLEDREPGERFIGSVTSSVRRTYSKLRVAPTTVTLASRTGFVPVTIANESGLTFDVTVRLISDRRLDFPNGDSRRLSLPPGTQTFTFPARVQTTGRFPIKIQVRTPVDDAIAETIAETQIVVRSTAYNRVALFVTAGAALFLLMWWGRRFLPRRKGEEI